MDFEWLLQLPVVSKIFILKLSSSEVLQKACSLFAVWETPLKMFLYTVPSQLLTSPGNLPEVATL
jgi:hypothetical protein